MFRLPAALAIVLLSTACAYHAPTSPTVATPAAAVANQIVLRAFPGIGNGTNTAAISATVQDRLGAGIGGVTVTFSTTGGTVSPASVVTDNGGLAQTTLTAVKPATITASAGGVSASTLAAIAADLLVNVTTTAAVTNTLTSFNASAQQPNGAVSFTFNFGDGFFAGPGGASASHLYARSGTYTIAVSAVDAAGRSGATTQPLIVTDPPVVTPPAPTPPPAPGVLAITVECTAAARFTPTGCHVTMTGAKGEALTSTITSTTWDWSDGDPTTVIVTPAEATHSYAIAGTFVVIATAHAPSAPTAGVTNATTVKIP